jgi:hypothetical protein
MKSIAIQGDLQENGVLHLVSLDRDWQIIPFMPGDLQIDTEMSACRKQFAQSLRLTTGGQWTH